MKKAISVILIAASLLLTIGCVSGTEKIAKQKTFEQGDYRYEDENLIALISINKEIVTDNHFDFDI